MSKLEQIKKPEYINSIEGLHAVLHRNEENIIYGASVVGRTVLRYLSAYDLEKQITCLAVKSRMDNMACGFASEGVPMIEISCLGHYYSSATFIVATMADKHDEIISELSALGCKNIVVVHEDLFHRLCHIDMEHIVAERLRSKQMSELFDRLETLEWKIEEQNEVCAVNTAAFKQYQNCNRGKDIVIAATGPTLQYYDVKKDAIHIGMNGTWRREDIPLDYYFIQDGNRKFIDIAAEGLKTEKVRCKVFIGRFLKRGDRNLVEFPEEYSADNENAVRYYADMMDLERERGQNIYRDICYHPLMEFGSVVFPAIHFALYTYPKRIYLAGCDVAMAGHFYESADESKIKEDLIGSEIKKDSIRKWRIGYAKVKMFADTHYPETEIISVNPVGLKGLFKDEFTEGYLREKNTVR